MNLLDFARRPSWFREGLATYASGGGGAETVSDDEARAAIRGGRRITPLSSGSLLIQGRVAQDGLCARLADREASLFTAFIARNSRGGLRGLIDDLIDGRSFAEAIASRTGMTVDDAWNRFVTSLGGMSGGSPPPRACGVCCLAAWAVTGFSHKALERLSSPSVAADTGREPRLQPHRLSERQSCLASDARIHARLRSIFRHSRRAVRSSVSANGSCRHRPW
jgi:hypothetical protein